MSTLDRPNSIREANAKGRMRALAAAEHRLQNGGYAALRDVRCGYERGVPRLHGRLRTHYLKQMALELVADVEGVHVVINQIQVVATPGEGRLGPENPPPRPWTGRDAAPDGDFADISGESRTQPSLEVP